jgi:hypothetical protein
VLEQQLKPCCHCEHHIGNKRRVHLESTATRVGCAASRRCESSVVEVHPTCTTPKVSTFKVRRKHAQGAEIYVCVCVCVCVGRVEQQRMRSTPTATLAKTNCKSSNYVLEYHF